MTTTLVPSQIDFQALRLAHEQRSASEWLREQAKVADFKRSADTEWCFRKVASYLEDGWTDFQNYVTLREEFPYDLPTFAHILNKVAGGTRFSERRAEEEKAPWIGEGEWPTRLDAAAFLFYVCCEASA